MVSTSSTSRAEGHDEPSVRAAWCAFYGTGIIGMLLLYGLLQERIMSLPYGDAKFTDSVFLVMCNRIVAVFFALAMAFWNGEALLHQAPLWKYFAISFSNVYASACQYEALKYVTFPVQMLGKSFKMIPVMLWGMVVAGKSYTTSDWLIAAAVTGGVTEFLMSGPISSHATDSGNSMWGLLLIVGFLALDGFTSTFQEKLFKDHSTTKYNQMLYVNLGSTMISVATLLASGGLSSAILFATEHPPFILDASALSFAYVGGQWFIYSMVKEFGALALAAITNVRQVVSVLISYMYYDHSVTIAQMFALGLVFGALFYKSYEGYASSTEERHPLARDRQAEEQRASDADSSKA